jgi:hypothetical protein
MSVFGRYKLSEEQVKEIMEQLKDNPNEMDNCLSDYAIQCWELFRVQETQNIEILYWMRIVKLSDGNYELQFIRELQSTW